MECGHFLAGGGDSDRDANEEFEINKEGIRTEKIVMRIGGSLLCGKESVFVSGLA